MFDRQHCVVNQVAGLHTGSIINSPAVVCSSVHTIVHGGMEDEDLRQQKIPAKQEQVDMQIDTSQKYILTSTVLYIFTSHTKQCFEGFETLVCVRGGKY